MFGEFISGAELTLVVFQLVTQQQGTDLAIELHGFGLFTEHRLDFLLLLLPLLFQFLLSQLLPAMLVKVEKLNFPFLRGTVLLINSFATINHSHQHAAVLRL